MSGPFAAASAADKQAIEKLTLDLQSYDDRWDELAAFAKSDVNEVVADLAARANEALKMKPQDARDRFQGLVQAHADAIHKLIDLQALGKLAADFMDDFMAIKASTSQLQTIKDTSAISPRYESFVRDGACSFKSCARVGFQTSLRTMMLEERAFSSRAARTVSSIHVHRVDPFVRSAAS